MVKYNKIIEKVVEYMDIDDCRWDTMFSGCALYGTFLNCILESNHI